MSETDEVPPPAKRLCPSNEGRTPTAQAIHSSIIGLERLTDQESTTTNKLLLDTSNLYKSESVYACKDDNEDRGGGIQYYHCDACQTDITNVFRIRCGECLDFDLCVSCFVNGVETGTHRNDHSYIPIGRNDFPIFTPEWNADEEIMLLEGVSKFGFGNWGEIAELIALHNTQPKSKDECEEHYYSIHIFPYREHRPVDLSDNNSSAGQMEYQKRMIGKYHFPLPQMIKPSSTGNTACNIIGFMPLRGDFDIEYDNDAELILSDIEFRGDETPIDRELKLKVLDIYNARVNERILRKKVIIEKGLVDWRRTQQLGKRRVKEEVDFLNLFRLLARFDLEPDYEELANLFLAERKLRHRLHVLNEWRSLGLRTLQDVEAYEKLKSLKISGAPISAEDLAKIKTNTRHVSTTESNESSNVSNESQKKNSEISQYLEAPASEYPGAALLTKTELEFCDTLQIPPIYFILTKYSLLNALIQQYNPNTLHQKSTLRLDALRQGNLFDFILHSKLNLPDPTYPPNVLNNASSSSATMLAYDQQSSAALRKRRTRQKQSCNSTANGGKAD